MQNEPKKNGINWSGIAALTTAISGVVGMFFLQNQKGNEVDMTQESAFAITNARIDDMVKRLDKIEMIFMAVRSPSFGNALVKECQSDIDCAAGHICYEDTCINEAAMPGPPLWPKSETKEEKREKLLEKFKDFDKIKEYVQTEQKPLKMDD